MEKNCSFYIIRFEPSVYKNRQIIYSLTAWTDGRIFNQIIFVNGQSKHLFIDQLSVSLSVNKMSPSSTQLMLVHPSSQ